jgi:hypothetical protein
MIKEKKGGYRLITSIILLLLLSCLREENIAYTYLPILKKIPVKIVHEKKILIDPSYNYPYNLYLELLIDTLHRKELISQMFLKTEYEVDTIELKKNTNLDEFRYYFEMKSVNINRISGYEAIEKKIRWWPQNIFTNPIYSNSFLDTPGVKKIVPYNHSKNGRIAMAIDGMKVFILIECWG